MQIVYYLFNIKKPFRNLLGFVVVVSLTALLKIGLIINKEITEQNLFQTWMWAVSLMCIIGVIILLYLSAEGFFIITEGLLLLYVILPVITWNYIGISFYLLIAGIIGYVIYVITENSHKKRQKPRKIYTGGKVNLSQNHPKTKNRK